MFDLSFPAPTDTLPAILSPMFANAAADASLCFALTTPDQSPASAMSGAARPRVLDRFATLADAMRAGCHHLCRADWWRGSPANAGNS